MFIDNTLQHKAKTNGLFQVHTNVSKCYKIKNNPSKYIFCEKRKSGTMFQISQKKHKT